MNQPLWQLSYMFQEGRKDLRVLTWGSFAEISVNENMSDKLIQQTKGMSCLFKSHKLSLSHNLSSQVWAFWGILKETWRGAYLLLHSFARALRSYSSALDMYNNLMPCRRIVFFKNVILIGMYQWRIWFLL